MAQRTIDKVLAWASQEKDHPVKDGGIHHTIWTDLEELYQQQPANHGS